MDRTPTRLSGHKSCVNDIASCEDRPLLATASQDGTVRIWDSRTNKSVKCFRGQFITRPQLVKFSVDAPDTVYTCDETNMYELDLRAEGILIQTPPRGIVDRGDFHSVDINALAVSHGFAAVGDDDGRVAVFNIGANGSLVQVAELKGVHTNLIGSVAIGFRSGYTAAYSGGFDSVLVSWDICAGELKSFDFGSFYAATTNPPFVHALSLISLEKPDDHIITALGNGRLCLMNCEALSPVASVEASGGMISSLFCNGHRVCSAANGGSIKVFDVVAEVIPAECEPIKMTASEKRRHRRKGKVAKSADPAGYEFCTVAEREHVGSKINAVTGSFGVDCIKLYVADTSSDIFHYTIC